MQTRTRSRSKGSSVTFSVSLCLCQEEDTRNAFGARVCVCVRKSAPRVSGERKKEESQKIKIRTTRKVGTKKQSEKKAEKKNCSLGKPLSSSALNQRKREYEHVETKRFDVRGKSARQQRPNENGVGRAEERNGCVFF